MITSIKRVTLLWAIILGLFALFNAVYWPVIRYKEATDPLSFEERAIDLYESGRRAEALAWLREGIEVMHPPYASPYERLQNWYTEYSDPVSAASLGIHATFYRALETQGAVARKALFLEAAQTAASRRTDPLPSDLDTGAINGLLDKFRAAALLMDPLQDWRLEEKVALLELSGKPLQHGRIGSTGVSTPTTILVQSGGGHGPGRTASIFVGSRNYAEPMRGLHIALVDPWSGEVTQWRVFDIWESLEETDRARAFLGEAAKGVIGAFAVYDDAAANMTPELERALGHFGLAREAVVDRNKVLLGPQFSFAAIGVKGALPGTAIQVWSPGVLRGYGGHAVFCGVVPDRKDPA